jgi:protein required for attachment to host cells
MKRACIAIVDAAHARIYTYDPAESNGVHAASDRTLHEEVDLVNPGRRGHDLFSTTKPGIERIAPGGGTTDDHRESHFDQLERNFARQIIEEVDRIARERAFTRIILVTPPKMLGELRKADRALHRPEMSVEYLERDLARLTSSQIHDHLADLRMISPRRRQKLTSR